MEISRTYKELVALRDEREMFVMASDETLPEFVYEKKLSEYGTRIAVLEKNLTSLEEEYQDTIADESRSCSDEDEAAFNDAEDEFKNEFEQLTHVDGAVETEPLDDIANVEELEEADRQAHYDQYGD